MTTSLLPQTNQPNNKSFWQKSLFKKAAVLSAVTMLGAGSVFGQCSITAVAQGSTSACSGAGVTLKIINAPATQTAGFDDLLTNAFVGQLINGYHGFDWRFENGNLAFPTGAPNLYVTNIAGWSKLAQLEDGNSSMGSPAGFTGLTNGFYSHAFYQRHLTDVNAPTQAGNFNSIQIDRNSPFDFLGANFVGTGNLLFPNDPLQQEEITIVAYRKTGLPSPEFIEAGRITQIIRYIPETGTSFGKKEAIDPKGQNFKKIDRLVIKSKVRSFIMDDFKYRAGQFVGEWFQDDQGLGIYTDSYQPESAGIYQFRGTLCSSNPIVVSSCNSTARMAGPAVIGDVVKQTTLSAYPNPVSSVANVQFKLAAEGAYKAELVDLKGSVISVIGAGEGQAGESYSLELSNKNLPSGIYMIRLVSASGVNYQKVMVN